jgi:hypothetical protein
MNLPSRLNFLLECVQALKRDEPDFLPLLFVRQLAPSDICREVEKALSAVVLGGLTPKSGPSANRAQTTGVGRRTNPLRGRVRVVRAR